jgi:hypothetical protein
MVIQCASQGNSPPQQHALREKQARSPHNFSYVLKHPVVHTKFVARIWPEDAKLVVPGLLQHLTRRSIPKSVTIIGEPEKAIGAQ